MARSFNGSTSFLNAAASSVGFTASSPWSASCWFKPSSLPGSGNIMSLFAKRGGGSSYFEIFLQNNAGTTGFGGYNGTNLKVFGTISTNQWVHGLCTADSTSLIVYINGASAGTDTNNYNSGSNAGLAMQIAAQAVGATADFFAGSIADVAFWNNIKLTALEASSLGAGARPNTIRPANLAINCPLDGLQSPEPDLSGNAHNFTLNSSPTLSSGPPFAPFTPRWPQFNFLAAVQTFQPAWARSRNTIIEGVAT